VSSIAIFHDNFAQMGGAERVADALTDAVPTAPLYTTLAARAKLIPRLRERDIHTTWMRYLPQPGRYYRHYFLLYPLAIETANLRAYDLILSSCCGYAKGVKSRADAVHVCYCHTPMRWIWRHSDYVAREQFSQLQQRALSMLLPPLRKWDLHAAQRPDYFLTNSQVVAERIREFYGREATVIPPPVDVSRFRISAQVDDFYLVLTRLVSYKRIDLAVRACNLLGRRLIVIGDGPDRPRLEAIAGPTITFMGRQPDDVVNQAVSSCRALLLPGEEDFGIVPLEANAAGRPVIALRRGGATETVRDGLTGVFFDEQTPEGLAAAIERADRIPWAPDTLRSHAAAYDRPVFTQRIRDFLHAVAPSKRVRQQLAAGHV
jgi:glycosyltransferase involved in cell wall biosynthesis